MGFNIAISSDWNASVYVELKAASSEKTHSPVFKSLGYHDGSGHGAAQEEATLASRFYSAFRGVAVIHRPLVLQGLQSRGNIYNCKSRFRCGRALLTGYGS